MDGECASKRFIQLWQWMCYDDAGLLHQDFVIHSDWVGKRRLN